MNGRRTLHWGHCTRMYLLAEVLEKKLLPLLSSDRGKLELCNVRLQEIVKRSYIHKYKVNNGVCLLREKKNYNYFQREEDTPVEK